MSFVSDSECMIANAINVLWEALLEWSLSGVKAKRSLSGVAATVKSFGSESNRSLSGVSAKSEACREWQQV